MGRGSDTNEAVAQVPVLTPAFHALLKHPLRHAIVIKLGEGPASPRQLAERLGRTERQVSDQIKILREAEPPLVELLEVKTGPQGGQRHIYRARHVMLTAADWDQLPEPEQATSTATIVQTLQGEMVRSVKAGVFHAHPSHVLLREAMNLDDEGMSEVDAILCEARERVVEARRRSATRRAVTGESPKRVITGYLSFIAAPVDCPAPPE